MISQRHYPRYRRGGGRRNASARPAAGSARDRIQAQLNALSKRERQVAEFVLGNPSTVLFATAADIARHAHVVPATVVRFARSVGFNGFTQFREAIRSEYPVLQLSTEHLDERLRRNASKIEHLVDDIRAQTLENATQTFARLRPAALDKAVEYLRAARRVVIAGTATSQVIATHLHCVLQTAEIRSQLVTDWAELLFVAPSLDAADAVVAITVSSYMKVTVEALRLGRQAGARTIFLTDAPFAPGAENADVTLFFVPKAFGAFLSPVAGSALVDCVAAVLAVRAPNRTKQGMQQIYDLMRQHELSYR